VTVPWRSLASAFAAHPGTLAGFDEAYVRLVDLCDGLHLVDPTQFDDAVLSGEFPGLDKQIEHAAGEGTRTYERSSSAWHRVRRACADATRESATRASVFRALQDAAPASALPFADSVSSLDARPRPSSSSCAATGGPQHPRARRPHRQHCGSHGIAPRGFKVGLCLDHPCLGDRAGVDLGEQLSGPDIRSAIDQELYDDRTRHGIRRRRCGHAHGPTHGSSLPSAATPRCDADDAAPLAITAAAAAIVASARTNFDLLTLAPMTDLPLRDRTSSMAWRAAW